MAASYMFLVCRVENLAAQKMAELIWAGPQIGANYGRRSVTECAELLMACAGGVRAGNVWASVVDDSGTKPAGNIVCTQANAAGDTITFTWGTKTVVLTEAAVPANENQFFRGASDNACATNLRACIVAHSILGRLYTVGGATNNVALTSKFPTQLMEDMALTTNDGTAFAFTQFTGGTEGAAQWFLSELKLQRTP